MMTYRAIALVMPLALLSCHQEVRSDDSSVIEIAEWDDDCLISLEVQPIEKLIGHSEFVLLCGLSLSGTVLDYTMMREVYSRSPATIPFGLGEVAYSHTYPSLLDTPQTLPYKRALLFYEQRADSYRMFISVPVYDDLVPAYELSLDQVIARICKEANKTE